MFKGRNVFCTLKQMKKEKGMVTRTSNQQMMVRIHPHTPIPVSLSSANETMKKQSAGFYCHQQSANRNEYITTIHADSAPNCGYTLVLTMAGSNMLPVSRSQ